MQQIHHLGPGITCYSNTSHLCLPLGEVHVQLIDWSASFLVSLWWHSFPIPLARLSGTVLLPSAAEVKRLQTHMTTPTLFLFSYKIPFIFDKVLPLMLNRYWHQYCRKQESLSTSTSPSVQLPKRRTRIRRTKAKNFLVQVSGSQAEPAGSASCCHPVNDTASILI